jgi:stage II sporulation protein D
MLFIRGGGDGHGIGMSQYGAYGYALHGKGYKFILHHYYRGTALGHTDPRRVVRVLLATGSAAFAGATGAAGKTLNPSATYSVRPLAYGSLGVFDASGKRVARGSAPLTATGPGPLSVAGLGSYRGALEFRPDGSGGVETVEAVGLDDYVRGVISQEVPASWSPEALKTQAVAARTYAITTDVGAGAYNLYPDTRSQMYGGVGAETPSTDAAVAATQGQVVTYNGVPVVTYFFNSSGGHTENIENVWPGATPEPWLRGVPDPYDAAGGDPYHRWGSQMTLAAAAAKLGALVKGSLLGIRVTRHGSSPRILTAEVIGTRGSVSVTGIELQQAFGLLTTYASFTTISSGSMRPNVRPTGVGLQVPGNARVMAAIAARVTPNLTGHVFPGAAGARVSVQASSRSRWRTVARGALGRRGGYSISLPGKGVYRVVSGWLAGQAVRAR